MLVQMDKCRLCSLTCYCHAPSGAQLFCSLLEEAASCSAACVAGQHLALCWEAML